MLHCGDSVAASGYVGHPVAGLKWRQVRKPEMRGPSLRERILGCSHTGAQPSSWALVIWSLGLGQACLLVGV